jgi:hypothetical protein
MAGVLFAWQEVWWRSLAVQVTVWSRAAASGQLQPRPLQPERCCPDYGAGYAWSPEFVHDADGFAKNLGESALRALLRSEVWWLWPWQLQVLEAAAAMAAASVGVEGQEAGPSAATTSPASTAAGAAGTSTQATVACDAGRSSSHHTSSKPRSEGSGSKGAGSSSTSSSSSSFGKARVWLKQHWADDDHRRSGSIPYPLTPALVAPGCVPHPQCPLPPVTRQQLQLVLGLLVGDGGYTFTWAALLLVLLLQRADPGLRAAFLNGPEASLLLVTLVTWGCHPGEWGERGAPTALAIDAREHTWEGAVKLLVDSMSAAETGLRRFPYPSSAALILSLCYLEPAVPRHLDGQQQQALVGTHNGPTLLYGCWSRGEDWTFALYSATFLHQGSSLLGPCAPCLSLVVTQPLRPCHPCSAPAADGPSVLHTSSCAACTPANLKHMHQQLKRTSSLHVG